MLAGLPWPCSRRSACLGRQLGRNPLVAKPSTKCLQRSCKHSGRGEARRDPRVGASAGQNQRSTSASARGCNAEAATEDLAGVSWRGPLQQARGRRRVGVAQRSVCGQSAQRGRRSRTECSARTHAALSQISAPAWSPIQARGRSRLRSSSAASRRKRDPGVPSSNRPLVPGDRLEDVGEQQRGAPWHLEGDEPVVAVGDVRNTSCLRSRPGRCDRAVAGRGHHFVTGARVRWCRRAGGRPVATAHLLSCPGGRGHRR